MKKCYHSQAPLPFVGQKLMFASEFRKVLKRFSDRTVFVDLFGGSGPVSYTHLDVYKRQDIACLHGYVHPVVDVIIDIVHHIELTEALIPVTHQ